MDQLVTREGRLFQVADERGDFSPESAASGLYMDNTRFLSRFELRIGGRRPTPLAASAADNIALRVYAQAFRAGAEEHDHAAPPNLAVRRQRVLHDGVLYERVTVTNYGLDDLDIALDLCFDADYADVFEVRGLTRPVRGERLPTTLGPDTAILGYRGLDHVVRRTRLRFDPVPARVDADHAHWTARIPGQGAIRLAVTVVAEEDGVAATPLTGEYDAAHAALEESYAAWRRACTAVKSDSDAFNRLLERSLLDLRLLRADLGAGPFFVAGIPWFAVPFGRDSLITAIEALPLDPEPARGTLRTLAALQGRVVDEWRREEPGKIPHELRRGEMAALDEIPFGRYYGSVDGTMLFLILLCDYYAWTADLALARDLLPNVRAALDWIDHYGDRDGDGFVEYEADTGRGLAVQSWKDSRDSMSHRDGAPARGAIAVSEAQGYVYDAKRRLAPIVAALGETDVAERLTAEAETLRGRFAEAFWMDDRDYPAIALDGAKRQVGTVASDAGHLLWSGILDDERAARVARRLVAPDLFSGWGVRTLSARERTYNPLSYHNGSVWPHDTALCVRGLKRYGFDAEVNLVASGLLRASAHVADARLPELFCGFAERDGPPVPYQLACAPQAWAAAAAFALTQAMLGLEPDAAASQLRLRPSLPDGIGRIALRGLRVGQAVVDLEVTRDGVQSNVRTGTLDIIVEPS